MRDMGRGVENPAPCSPVWEGERGRPLLPDRVPPPPRRLTPIPGWSLLPAIRRAGLARSSPRVDLPEVVVEPIVAGDEERHPRRPAAQRPFQAGGRFSAKARVPSSRSSLA